MTTTEPPLECPDDHATVTYERAEVNDDRRIWTTHRLRCTGCDACVRIQEVTEITAT